MADHNFNEGKERPRRSIVPKVILTVCILGALICAGLFISQQLQLMKALQKSEEDILAVKESLAENPIDFEALQAENADIYAWIEIPNTKVNYPIFQHPENDFFYLNHNRAGEKSIEGAIYTELQNSKDFTDAVTVVYGHNIKGGLMFNTLHNFEDQAFFDENPEFKIYVPGHILTYKVIAASGADDAHILNTHNFEDENELIAYFESILNPKTEQGHVRADAALDKDSKIVQLSTCNYTNGNERYVVTGVLVDDQPTG